MTRTEDGIRIAPRHDRLRLGLIALAGLGVAGTAVELAILRHWNGLQELVPWLTLTIAGAATAALAARPTWGVVRTARWVGLGMAATGVYGLTIHILANMSAAPLSGTVGATWDSLGLGRQVWMAATGGVGPAAPLSAASLTPTGLALALATVDHPSRSSRGQAAGLRG